MLCAPRCEPASLWVAFAHLAPLQPLSDWPVPSLPGWQPLKPVSLVMNTAMRAHHASVILVLEDVCGAIGMRAGPRGLVGVAWRAVFFKYCLHL